MALTNTTISQNDARLDDWAKDEPQRPADLLSRIKRIESTHTLPRDRGEAVLSAVSEGLGAVAGLTAFNLKGEEYQFRIDSEAPGADAWRGVLQDAALEARSHARTVTRVYGGKTNAPELVVIASPLDLSEREPFGTIAVLCRCDSALQAERLQLHLRSAAILASGLLAQSQAHRPTVQMDDFARVLSQVGQYRSIEQFTYAITNSAKQRFGCEQAALGMLRGDNIKVVCISGMDEVKHRTPGVHQIEQAMGECADAGTPIVSQPGSKWEGEGPSAEGMLHDRWRAACAGASVATVPIMSGDELVAVLALRRRPDEFFEGDELHTMQSQLTPLGSAFALVAQSTRSLPAHTIHSARNGLAWLAHPGSIRKKLIILAAAVGIVGFAVMPTTYRVTTPCSVVAGREHVVASTADAPIERVLVRSGDPVKAGQPLVRLDTRHLETEAAGLMAEIERANLRMRLAVAEGDPASASVARAERDITQSRVKEVQARIAAAVITAPVDGVVTGTELSNLEGRVVPIGQPLMSIAERGSMSLELLVPESQISDVPAGARVRFASHARPETPGETRLARLAPSGVERDNKIVFLGQGTLPEGQDWLRPGMEGVAIIDMGRKPIWWIATHRLSDTARLNFWIE